MSRLVKRLLLAGAVVFAVLILGFVGTILFLGSKAGARYLLGKANAAASEAGWKLSAESMELDVFHRLHLKNVRLTRSDDFVTVDSMTVTYRIGLFPPAMEVTEAAIVAPKVRLHRTVTGTPPNAANMEPGAGLDTARQWLESPPAKLTVKTFAVRDVAFDYESVGPGDQRVAAKGTVAELHGDLAAEAKHFTLHGELRAAVVESWSFHQGDTTGDGALEMHGKASVDVAEKNGRWAQRIEIRDSQLVGKSIAGRFGKKRDRWSVGAFTASTDGALSLGSPTPLSPDRISVEVLEGESRTTALNILIGDRQRPMFASPRVAVVNTGKRGDNVRVEARGTLAKATITGVRGPLEAGVFGTLEAPLDFKKLDFRAQGTAEGQTIGEGGMTVVAGNPTTVTSWGTLLLKAPLTRRVSSLAAVTGTDGARGSFNFDGVVKAPMTHALDAPAWATAPVESKFRATWVPEGRRDASWNAGKIESQGTLTRHEGDWKFQGDVQSDRVLAGKSDIERPQLESTASYAKDGTSTVTFAATMAGEKFAEGTLTLGTSQLKGEAKATVTAAMSKHLGVELGRWSTRASFASRWKDGVHTVDAAGDLRQETPTPSPAGEVRLAGAATWKLNGTHNFEDGSLKGDFDGELPAMDVKTLGHFGATRAHGTVESTGAPGRENAKVVAMVKQEDLRFEKTLAPGLPVLRGVQLELRASLAGGARVTLEKMDASLGDKLVSFSAKGLGRVDRGSGQLNAKFSADVPPSFPMVAGQRFSGKMEMPLTINVGGGRDIDVDGDFILSKVQWSKDDMAMSGIGGRVPLHYQLVREGNAIRFAYLTVQNPFERVDFERLRPLLARAEQVRVNEVRFADRRYGPILGMFSMRQNLLFAHTFDASFGKNGSLGGEFFADLNPNHVRIGLLSRVTAINLTEVLPTRSLVRVPSGTQTVSGRSGIVVDVRSGTADGRFDITEIGAAQLVTLINACDPTFENEQFNLARTALGVGYPTFVGAKLERGFMDLAIDLKVVGTSQHFDVRGVPLSTFLASAFADARTQMAKEKVQ